MAKVQHRREFKEDAKDLITMLSRVFGYPNAGDFYPWMVKFILTIFDKKIDWTTLISDNIHEQLKSVLETNKFYMTSYLVYMLDSQATFLGLIRLGSFQLAEVKIYEHYPQLKLEDSYNFFCGQ